MRIFSKPYSSSAVFPLVQRVQSVLHILEVDSRADNHHQTDDLFEGFINRKLIGGRIIVAISMSFVILWRLECTGMY